MMKIDNGGTFLIEIPMNDPRTGQTVWATTEFGPWLDVVECGADSAWV